MSKRRRGKRRGDSSASRKHAAKHARAQAAADNANQNAELAARLQKAGLRVTGPRLTILRALEGDLSHPTPEALYQRLRPDNANLSLATLYKTLLKFDQAGLCQRLLGCGPQMRVDSNCRHHWHVVCSGCGRVEDVQPPAGSKLELPTRAGSMAIRSMQVYLSGLCPKCQQGGQSGSGPASR